ncbi:MAG: orotate phosphoribosyltransferase [Clostridia bacterium]|nr:orotate phosphoribosyltransferase [Clostridia bacterium]
MKTKGKNLYLRVVKGHFATGRSHSNYFIDVTMQKSRVSEAEAVAKELVQFYNRSTMIDTILCLDEMQVVGAFFAKELVRGDFMNMNAHQTVYVVTPEQTNGNQLIFRDSVAPMIQGKHVLILAASVNTGYTAKAAAEAISYYGGHVVGIAAIFATTEECMGHPVCSVFDPHDIEDYQIQPSHICPLCRNGQKIDALVNSFGFSKL